MIADKIETLLADKGYDANLIREELAKAEIEAVIPNRNNRRNPVPHDRTTNIAGAISSGACPTNSRTGDELQLDMTQPSKAYLGFVSLVSELQWVPLVHEI